MGTQNNDDKYPVYSGYGYDLSQSGEPPDHNEDNKQKIDYELPKRGKPSKDDSQAQAGEDKDISKYGDLITVNLANRLVKDFFTEFVCKITEIIREKIIRPNQDKFMLREEEIRSLGYNVAEEFAKYQVYETTFSKDVLTMLLSQPKCDGIKFYYCMGLPRGKEKKRRPSLVLVGVDDKGKDLRSREPNGSIITNKQENTDSDVDAQSFNAARQQTLVYEVGGVDRAGKAIKFLSEEIHNLKECPPKKEDSDTITGDE
jgi:hypothetical protein